MPVITNTSPTLETRKLSENHLPGLDGIRGLAILLVLLLHVSITMNSARTMVEQTTVAILSGGWCGVDLFFTLSGFLITGILLDSKGSSAYFRNFYWRRTLRIFPLYYGSLLFIFGLRPLLIAYFRHHVPVWQPNLAWYVTYLQNWYPRIGLDAPMGLFWSLGVEEQFYLVWPLVVKRTTRCGLIAICTGLVVCALLFRVLAVASGHYDLAYTLTPMRVDGLALGALGAIFIRDDRFRAQVTRWRPFLFSIAAFVLIFTIVRSESARFDTQLMATIGTSAYALLFGSLTFQAALPSCNRMEVMLSNPVLRSFGKYSYGIYITHTYVMGWCSGVIRSTFDLMHYPWRFCFELSWYVAMLLVCWCVGWASWRFFERHFLGLRSRVKG